MTATRITGTDMAFVAHELSGKPGHTSFHVAFRFAGSAPGITVLRNVVAERWGPVARLGLRVCGPGGKPPRRYHRRLYWTGHGFDALTQVRAEPVPAGKTLADVIAALSAQPVPLARGGWRLHLIDGYSAVEFALLFQVNHALADGVAATSLLDQLLRPAQAADGKRRGSVPTIGRRQPSPEPSPRQAVRPLLSLATSPGAPLPFNDRHFLDGQPGRYFGWQEVQREALRNARQAARLDTPPSSNDVCLAVVAGALRNALTETGDRIPRCIQVIVPVNTRDPGTAGYIGNAISHVRVRLPLRTSDPVRRVENIALATRDEKTLRFADGVDAIVAMTGRLPPVFAAALSSAIVFSSPRYAATICTAIPGFSRDLALAGRPMLGGVGGAALMGCHGMVFAFGNFRGQYIICVTADAAHRPFAEAVHLGLARELNTLAHLTSADRDMAPA